MIHDHFLLRDGGANQSVRKAVCACARPYGKVSKVFSRTATSMVLLTALMAGIITPTGVCALVCERHSQAGTQHHCDEDSDSMPGMVHDHSAMHHAVVGNVILVVGAQSCQTDCAKAEQLNISTKVVPQVTAVETGAVVPVLDATSMFLAPQVVAAWSLDSGPPSLSSAYTASYSVLRI
jgi:hypothetical protein